MSELLSYNYYNYDYSNFKATYKLLFIIAISVIGGITIFYIKNNKGDIKIILILSIILLLLILALLYIRFIYKTNNFEETEDNVLDEAVDYLDSLVKHNLSESELLADLGPYESLSYKYKVKTSFYIKQLSDKLQIILKGNLRDSTDSITGKYNPIVYIVPNTTDLFIEIRTEDLSKKLYDTYYSNKLPTDDNIEELQNVLNICLENCSDNDNCKGVNYGGKEQSTLCQLVTNDYYSSLNRKEKNDYNNELKNTNNRNNSYNFRYYEKNNNFNNNNNITSKLVYDKSCIHRNLPLSTWIHCTIEYDHNNIYVKLKYNNKTKKKICHFNELYESGYYKKIKFSQDEDDNGYVIKKNLSVKS